MQGGGEKEDYLGKKKDGTPDAHRKLGGERRKSSTLSMEKSSGAQTSGRGRFVV